MLRGVKGQIRFLTVAFHFIIVKINKKESYIIWIKKILYFSFKRDKDLSSYTLSICQFVNRLSFLILCFHDVTETHQCKQRNENCVFINTLLNEF